MAVMRSALTMSIGGDGHYRVRIDGEWVDVLNEAVVFGPNRAGRTMVWPYYLDGHPKARCFMPRLSAPISAAQSVLAFWVGPCS
jgi:hypothetical protein